jgi:hypothetical protein
MLQLTNPFICTMALESAQSLTEMCTRDLTVGKRRPATSPPSVSQLSRKCLSFDGLDISQPYAPPCPVTGIALLFTFTYEKLQHKIL